MKTALITGATGGIGSAMTKTFAAAGYRVAVAYHQRKEAAHALCESLPGGEHYALRLAVDDAESVNNAFTQVAKRGGLSVLVNNAGFTRFVPHDDLAALDDDLIDGIFRVHVRGALSCVRAAVPLMRAAGGGSIINITSVAAQIATGSNVAYCAAKAALNTATKSLARALAPQIRVNALAPGLVDTDFIRGMNAEWRKQQIAATPLRRLTSPEEAARAAVLLADGLPTATGIILPVDGGRPLAA